MKLIQCIALISFLIMPTLSLADDAFDDDTPPVGDFDDTFPAVPEPSGLLVMGAALTTVAFAVRRQGR
jgi:hypothetical protein